MIEPVATASPVSTARPIFRLSLFLTAAAGFLLSCPLGREGFFSSDSGDVGRYHVFTPLSDGAKLPYRDFCFEYPPGALPPRAAVPLGAEPERVLAWSLRGYREARERADLGEPRWA